MSFPAVVTEIAFATKPGSSNPSWQDVSAFVSDWEVSRGRVYELDQTQPGSCSLTLDNTDRRFDPVFTAGPYYPYVLPRRRVRVRVVSPNLLANGDLEVDATGWLGSGTPAATVGRDSAFARFGTWSLKVTGANAANFQGGNYGYTSLATTEYTVSVWVYDAAGGTYILRDTDDILVNNDTVFTVPAGIWTRATKTYTTNANTTRAIRIMPQSGIHTFYIDGAVLELGATATPWIGNSGTVYYLFDGYIERWPQTYEGPQYAEVKITARDGFLPLAGALITGTYPTELTGARIARTLTTAQEPSSTPVATGGYWTLGTSQLGVNNRLGYGTPTTSLDAGQKMVAAVTYADADKKYALTHIQEVADSDPGIFFIDGQGRRVYHDLLHRIRTQTAAIILTDDLGATDATHIGYAAIATSFDYDRGANDITVTNAGGVAQNVTDGTAIDDYFRTTLSRSAVLATDTDAANLGRLLLRQLKDVRDSNGNPRLRVDSITIEPWAGDQWANVLAREISDRVNVIRNPGVHPASVVEAINMDCYIESVRHRGSDRAWETTFQLSPASPAADFWVLGTSTLGRSTSLL